MLWNTGPSGVIVVLHNVNDTAILDDIFTLTLISEANMIVISTAVTNNIMSNAHLECSTDGITYDTIDVTVLGMHSHRYSSIIITMIDTAQLSSPVDILVMAIDSSTVLLSWLPPDDSQCVTGYRIYSNSVLLDTITNITSYTVSDVSQGTIYYYNVSAIDKQDNEGQISQQEIMINFSGMTLFLIIPKFILYQFLVK